MADNNAVSSNKPPISAHTLRVMHRNRFAKGAIWAGAFITLALLIIIVGYVLINGLVSTETYKTETFPSARNLVTLDNGDEMVLLVHKSLHLDAVEYSDLRDIVMGTNPFWGFLTGQNRNISPYVVGDSEFAAAVTRYLNIPPGFGAEGLPTISGTEASSGIVNSDKGVLILAPADWGVPSGDFRVLGVRDVVLAVHPEVTMLQAGRRLGELRVHQVRYLFDGSASVWSDVGGPLVEISPPDPESDFSGTYAPLAVKSLSLPGSVAEMTVFEGITPGNPIIAKDSADLAYRISRVPGSVAVMFQKDVLEHGLDTLEIRYSKTRWNLRPGFLVQPPSRAGAVGGISYIIINTIIMVVVVLLVATPIGVSAAVFLVEYARQGRLVTILRVSTDTLMGIPSIIFGLFGMVFFSQFLHLKTGLLSGSLTLTLMILPTIVRTSEEALKSVPKVQREGSMALGASKLQTIVKIVLPAASPGILTGIILGIGRSVGETAALLFTMGSNMALLKSFNSPMRVLSVHLYMLIRENISVPNAFATATILIVIVFLVNYATRKLIGRINRMSRVSR